MKNLFLFYIKCGLFFSIISSAIANEKPTEFSIRLKQAPLVATLQQLALEHNANLIIDDELEGTISLQLKKTHFAHLLQSVARIKKLTLEQDKEIYYLTKKVATPVEKATPSNKAMDITKPLPIINREPAKPKLITASIKLHFAKASEVMKSLTTGNGSLLSANGSITFDDRSNLLVIQDEATSLKNIKRLIAELDKPIEQIAIEARIVTMNDESLKELGVRWGLLNPAENTHRFTGKLEANSTNIANQLNVNFPASTASAASAAIQVAKINGRLLDLELTALERENNVKIIANPRLLTTNKKSASIKQGTEIPYVLNNGRNETQSIEFREAVLGLEVTPHISKDNSILLDLVVSQNAPSTNVVSGNNEYITIDKQEINTQVFAKNGETIVLGGIFHHTTTNGVDKVPVLGDIPIVKKLFSKESKKQQKRELVIFVTPHILKQGQTLKQQ